MYFYNNLVQAHTALTPHCVITLYAVCSFGCEGSSGSGDNIAWIGGITITPLNVYTANAGRSPVSGLKDCDRDSGRALILAAGSSAPANNLSVGSRFACVRVASQAGGSETTRDVVSLRLGAPKILNQFGVTTDITEGELVAAR